MIAKETTLPIAKSSLLYLVYFNIYILSTFYGHTLFNPFRVTNSRGVFFLFIDLSLLLQLFHIL
nr:MAG TPA: hypothetical protein [Caudoviricetes sp.]DAN43302.1 MAG TPA: hypothetical protein [Caudoviricetes sp.]